MLRHATLGTIRRFWVLIAALGILGAVAAFGVSSMLTPTYRSTTSLYYTLNFGNSASDLAQGSTYTANQMQSFGELARSQVVLQPVIDELDLGMSVEQLSRIVTVTTPRDTVIMNIAVNSTDPEQAATIANALGEKAGNVAEEFAPRRQDGTTTVAVRTIREATPATFQTAPNKRMNAILGLAGGLLAGVLVAIGLAAADPKIRRPESLREVGSPELLGTVRADDPSASRTDGSRAARANGASEDARRLRSTLMHVTKAATEPITLVVASAVPGEGKTSIALGLADAFGESGQRVLLIDGDLRRPQLAQAAGVDGSAGLTDVLTGGASLAQTIRRDATTGIDILAAGAVPSNPGELLASPQMRETIEQARASHDIVLIDSAPLLSTADASTLGEMSDGVVVVARAGATRKSHLASALSSLRNAGANVLGVVLNGVPAPAQSRARYYTYASAPKASRAESITA